MLFKSVEAYIEALREDPNLTMIPLGLVAELKGVSRSAVAEQIRTGALDGVVVKGRRKTWRGVSPAALFAQAERLRQVSLERTGRLRTALETAAAGGTPVTYAQVMEAVGMASKNPRQRAEIGELLSAASKESFAAHGFLIGAIVVQKSSGQPNSLFFHLAREVGALAEGEDETAFWRAQCDRVFAQFAGAAAPAEAPATETVAETVAAPAEPAPAPAKRARHNGRAKAAAPDEAAHPSPAPAE